MIPRADAFAALSDPLRAVLLQAIVEGSIQVGSVGHVRRRRGASGELFYLDFGRSWGPRYLRSFRGIPFGDNRELAQGVLHAVEKMVQAGRPLADVLAELAPESADGATVDTLLEEWLEHFERLVRVGQRQPRTLAAYRRWARREFTWWQGQSLFSVTDATVEDFALHLAELAQPNGRPLSAKTQRGVLLGFRAFLSWAKKRRPGFQIPTFELPEVESRVPVTLTANQQLAVLEAISEEERGVFLALSTCGIRPSEARVIRVSCWSPEAKTIRIVEGAKDDRIDGLVRGPKRASQKRVVPAMPVLQGWLEEHVPEHRRRWEPEGWLFQNPKAVNETRQWGKGALHKIWNAACRQAGAQASLYEGTKHTLGTLLKNLGVDDRDIATIFGHGDIRSVAHYAKIAETSTRATLERLHGEDR